MARRLASILLVGLASGSGCHPPAPHASTFTPQGQEKTAIDSLLTAWMDDQLARLGEAPLRAAGPGEEIYRFVWMRTWHHPVVITAEWNARGGRLVGREFDGYGGYEPGSLLRVVDRPLRAAEWTTLKRALDSARFWTLPLAQPFPERGLDGATWTVEGAAPGRYHRVSRWSPEPDSPHAPFRAVGLQLLRFASMPADSAHAY